MRPLLRFDGMPRYFIHIFNDLTADDEEGVELADDRAALERATSEARILAAESVRTHGHLVLRHRLEVRGEQGRLVGSVAFGDVVRIVE